MCERTPGGGGGLAVRGFPGIVPQPPPTSVRAHATNPTFLSVHNTPVLARPKPYLGRSGYHKPGNYAAGLGAAHGTKARVACNAAATCPQLLALASQQIQKNMMNVYSSNASHNCKLMLASHKVWREMERRHADRRGRSKRSRDEKHVWLEFDAWEERLQHQRVPKRWVADRKFKLASLTFLV